MKKIAKVKNKYFLGKKTFFLGLFFVFITFLSSVFFLFKSRSQEVKGINICIPLPGKPCPTAHFPILGCAACNAIQQGSFLCFHPIEKIAYCTHDKLALTPPQGTMCVSCTAPTLNTKPTIISTPSSKPTFK